MGLTIHFDFKRSGTEQEIVQVLDNIRAKIEARYPEVVVEELRKLHWDNGYEDPNEDDRWKKIRFSGHRNVYPELGYIFDCKINDGCEWMGIGLCKFKDQKHWSGGTFCKTQYAENFIKAHLTVIGILDICKEEGILGKVCDEGDYWETRDLEVMGKAINESTAMIKSLGGTLKSLVEKTGGKIEGAIDTCENYVTKGVRNENQRKSPRNLSGKNRRF